MNFPKNIFQTWKNNEVPDKWKKAQQSVIDKNPNWKYTLLTDTDNENIVKQYFPEFYQIFMSLDGLTTWKIRPFMTLLILDITKILHLKFNTTVKQIYNKYVSNKFEITNHNFQ